MSPPTRQVTDEAVAPRRWEGERGRYPEDDEDYPRRFVRNYDDYGGPGRTGPLSNDYQVELGRWFGIGQAHFQGKMLLAALYVAFTLAITLSISFVQGLAAAVLPFADLGINFVVTGFIAGPLAAGLVIVALRQLKGEPWHFGHFFGGFSAERYLTLVGFSFLQELVSQIWFLPGQILLNIANQHLAQGGNQPQAQQLMPAGLIAFIVAIPFAIYFSIRLTMFGQQLILDRHYGAVDSLKGSWELTDGHFGGLFGAALVLGLVNVAGLLLCGIGFLFSMPFTVLVTTAGYLLIAGTRPPLEKPRPPGLDYERFDR
jgi:uncharacterized membrane protein